MVMVMPDRVLLQGLRHLKRINFFQKNFRLLHGGNEALDLLDQITTNPQGAHHNNVMMKETEQGNSNTYALRKLRKDIPDRPTDPCHNCHSMRWWLRTAWGPPEWLCGLCHPESL